MVASRCADVSPRQVQTGSITSAVVSEKPLSDTEHFRGNWVRTEPVGSESPVVLWRLAAVKAVKQR